MSNHDASPSERTESEAAGATATTLSGIRQLREKRGAERVSFNDVADHLVDFAERHPHAREEIDRLASFLAAVEQRPHQHLGDGSTDVSSR